MAAPSEVTLQNLAGKWTLNKSLSDDFTPILALQGVNVLVRKAIGTASVHLKISQPSEQELNMEQTATAASIPGTTEEYILDWDWRKNHDAFFGDIEGRSRWISQEEARHNGAEGDWEADDSQGKLIQAVGKKPDDAWTATHLWGFEKVDGAHRHTRRVKVTSKDGEELKVRMVYDFDGN
ncbi:hypothetical protein H2200_004203 [Cladophialophora chaetospira]|uniref:LCCL domain-containing protein n=1 Tax=Cladophialophora chaetospira TaxID=386627 RepID=A0AA39CLT1_9EURO|nr:hypothetical protein H2200_004203 [Cladophialophora chaetospira]